MDDLVARFDAGVPALWEPLLPPTTASVRTIETRFGFVLSPTLIALARSARSYSSVFLGLGPDVDSHRHLLARHALLHADAHWGAGGRLPAHLVPIMENFMEDFLWCLDLRTPGPEHEVEIWRSDEPYPSDDARFANVRAFVEDMIAWHTGGRERSRGGSP